MTTTINSVSDHILQGIAAGDLAASQFEVTTIAKELAARRAANTTAGEDDETYEIGKRDGYEAAVQHIDERTGGDGEYRYCTDHDPDRHTPDAPAMIERIVERFHARAASTTQLSQVGVSDDKLTELLHLLVANLGGHSIDMIEMVDGKPVGPRRLGFSVGRHRSIRLEDIAALFAPTLSALPAGEGEAVAWRWKPDADCEAWTLLHRKTYSGINEPLYTRTQSTPPASEGVTDAMVELAAEGYYVQQRLGFVCPPWARLNSEEKQQYRRNVRAALTAALASRNAPSTGEME